MKRLRSTLSPRLSPTAILTSTALLALVLLTAVLPGCGGVDSGGTGQTVESATTSSGRVTGFGSVIVNGIRFDDSHATVVDDDGVVRTRADLRLGMLVEVEGRLQGNSGQGSASRIQFGPAIAGPVTTVDTAGSRFTVLGQTVTVDVDTLYGGLANGLADLQVGQPVEVYAFYDAASGLYTATRIERRTALGQYVIRGRLSGLAPLPTRSFSIGGVVVDYGSIGPGALPLLSNGLLVRVSLNTTPVSGRWVATTVRSAQPAVPPEASEAELEGHVSGYMSSASFKVAGIPVDASRPGISLRHGTLANLANGVRVEVEGPMVGGVLVADRLDFKRGGDEEFELHGSVESVDVAAQTLELRGVTVTWDNRTRFAGGRVNELAPGARVEVKGTPSGGVRILADSIRFER